MVKLFGSLNNRITEGKQTQEPFIGMGVTEMLYSDRVPYTLIKIKSKTRILVQKDKEILISGSKDSENQSYKYKKDNNGKIVQLIKTKRGWKELNGTSYFTLGIREYYWDPCF